MTTRAFVLSLAVAAVVCAIGGRCTAPDPAPLPAKTQARVTRHIVQSAIDSSETKRLLQELERARRQREAMRDTAEMVAKAGLQAHRRADTLQAFAIRAQTIADSARAWQAAYDARSREAELLRLENAQQDSALTLAAHERMVGDSLFIIMAVHAARSDSLIGELLPLAQRRDHCSVLFGAIKCPTRKQVAVVGAIAGAAVAAVASGKIKVRLPIG